MATYMFQNNLANDINLCTLRMYDTFDFRYIAVVFNTIMQAKQQLQW